MGWEARHMVTISVGFDPGALGDYEHEMQGVEQLVDREQITDDEAREWERQAQADLIEKARIDLK